VLSNSFKLKEKLPASVDSGSLQRKQITRASFLLIVVNLSFVKPPFDHSQLYA
jgi:hypothetical protein